jgi:hypothetical protein
MTGECLDVARLDLDQAPAPEERERVQLEVAPVLGQRGRADAGARPALEALAPALDVCGAGDAGELAVLAPSDVGHKRRLQLARLGERACRALALATLGVTVPHDIAAAAAKDARRAGGEERAPGREGTVDSQSGAGGRECAVHPPPPR